MPNMLNSLLKEAVSQLKKQYENIVFYEADGLATNNFVARWCLVFSVKGGTVKAYTSGHKVIHSVFYPTPWVEDQEIKYPLKRSMSDCLKLMHKAGYEEPVGAVTVRKPLYPGVDEPYFIFNIGTCFVFVGINSGKVLTNPF